MYGVFTGGTVVVVVVGGVFTTAEDEGAADALAEAMADADGAADALAGGVGSFCVTLGASPGVAAVDATGGAVVVGSGFGSSFAPQPTTLAAAAVARRACMWFMVRSRGPPARFGARFSVGSGRTSFISRSLRRESVAPMFTLRARPPRLLGGRPERARRV